MCNSIQDKREALLNLTKDLYEKNSVKTTELDCVYSNNDIYFVIDECGVSFIEDQRGDMYCPYNGLYYLSSRLLNIVKTFLDNSDITIEDFVDTIDSCGLADDCLDVSEFEDDESDETFNEDEAYNEIVALSERFSIPEYKICIVIKMLLYDESIEAETWYMDFDGDFISLTESMGDNCQYIDFSEDELSEEEIDKWIEILSTIENNVISDGEIL